MAYNTKTGFFRPLNPDKYKGDPTQIVYRSWWEFVYMARLDKDKDVVWWQSEQTIIPYMSPRDNRIHRYYVDFTVKRKTTKGTRTELIEIKPYNQTIPPVLTEGKRKTKKYYESVMVFGVNTAKWKAAKAYCADRGYHFIIMTENELGVL